MQIMRYDYDVVADRGCDTFFFKLTLSTDYWLFDEATRDQHLAWFDNWDLSVEKVGYQGLLIGESGYYYVDFRDEVDPRLDLWCKMFEDADGTSLAPDKYNMYVYPYQHYIDKKATGEFEPIDPEDR